MDNREHTCSLHVSRCGPGLASSSHGGWRRNVAFPMTATNSASWDGDVMGAIPRGSRRDNTRNSTRTLDDPKNLFLLRILVLPGMSRCQLLLRPICHHHCYLIPLTPEFCQLPGPRAPGSTAR